MTTKNPTKKKAAPAKKKSAAKKSLPTGSRNLFLKGLILVSVVVLIIITLVVRQPPPDYDERPAERTIADLIPAPELTETPNFDLQVALELILWDVGLGLRNPRVTERQGVRTIALDTPYPEQPQLEALLAAVNQLPGSYRVEADGAATVVRLFEEDALRLLVKFVTPPVEHEERPQIALIVDDLGRDLRTVRRLLELDTALTFSILPSEAHARRAAELVHQQAQEVLIHLPMEPRGYPDKNPGDDALMVGMDAAEIRTRLAGFVSQVPYAVGGNNHMGSRFTEDRDGMRVVVDYLQQEEMFFVDSLTSHRSLAMETARTRQLPTAVRDVFLDNVQDVEAISAQLHKLVAVAKLRGRAIGICHPYPETLIALEREVEVLKASGLDFVPVSALLLR